MKKATDIQQIKEALDKNQTVFLELDGRLTSFTKEFWMLAPLILIFKALAAEEIYLEK